MIYICSDIHGEYKKFIKLLNTKIKFNPNNDHLYILGDIIDRGHDSLKMIELVRQLVVDKKCCTLIKGNHELFLQMYLTNQLPEAQWLAWGGKKDFIEQINTMSQSKRAELLKFITDLPHYINLETKQLGNVLLCHSGIKVGYCSVDSNHKCNVENSIVKAVQKDEFNYLISNDIHYVANSLLKSFDRYVIVGHVPCKYINEENRIYKGKYYMDLDTGAGNADGCVSIYRLDDGAEIYI